METYLARIFNHGASLVDIFAWGILGDQAKNDPFRIATEGKDSITAYQKFLRGEQLIEGKSSTTATAPLSGDFQAKIQKMQSALPDWVKQPGNAAKVGPLLQKFESYTKDNNITEAEKVVDDILKIIGMQ